MTQRHGVNQKSKSVGQELSNGTMRTILGLLRGVAVEYRLGLTSILDMQQYIMLCVIFLIIHLHNLWSDQCMTWRHGDVQILITIQVKDVEDIFYDVGIHPRFLGLYYRSELTNVNTALDKDTYQCTICKEKLYLKDPAQIREHPKLKVIICRVSTRHTCSKHAFFLKSDL